MRSRVETHEAQYRRTLGGASFASLALHLLLALGASSQWLARDHDDRPERVDLGYQGPLRIHPELEVLEPNSVQAFFYQRERRGRAPAVEYRVVHPELEIDPGPQPVPLPRRRPVEPLEEPQLPDESPDLVAPLPPLHTEISFSEEYVILKMVKPVYPEYELSRGIRGRVLVAVRVTPDGDLELEQVQESSADPPSASTRGFELATLEAVRQWKIRPPKRDAQAQGIWLTIPIHFDPEQEDFLKPSGVRFH